MKAYLQTPMKQTFSRTPPRLLLAVLCGLLTFSCSPNAADVSPEAVVESAPVTVPASPFDIDPPVMWQPYSAGEHGLVRYDGVTSIEYRRIESGVYELLVDAFPQVKE